MKTFKFCRLSLALTLFTALGCVQSQKAVAQTTSSTAQIINSGSTNTSSYTINVSPSGSATYTVGTTSSSGQISQSLTTKFFEDIKVAMPLSKLPIQHCVKSVSFGTTTQVKFQTQTSPDLSCPSSNSQVKNLYSDTQSIVQSLGISALK